MTRFPAGFVWGVAASAYQTEGAVTADGRGPSVWDTFTHRPAAVADGTHGDVACDHNHPWPEDLALLRVQGAGANRFSVAWPRVQPDASGRVNTAGLDFYDRLLDALAEDGVSATVCLFHWDLPQWVQDAGGWQDRATVERFTEYAAVVARRLGDRVGTWTPVNEMFEHFALGHVTGEHAPGLTLPLQEAAAVAHHLLLAGGDTVRLLHETSPAPVMAVNSYAPVRPYTDGEADRAMAGLYDVLQNRLFTDPPLLGRYPAELQPLLAPHVRDGDMARVHAPADLWGVNYYSVNAVRAVDDGGPVPLEVLPPDGHQVTAFGWAVAPEGLTETLTGLHDRYGPALPPLVVTENGCAYDDTLRPDGSCPDPDRVAFLSAHVDAVARALAAGVDVRGYYVWSLTDNFEWAEGHSKRFGLVHVDYPTQRRTPKTSFDWYRRLIADHRSRPG
jgi:beta-glucosidase